MWTWQALQKRELDLAVPLLSAIAPHDLAGFSRQAQACLDEPYGGVMTVRTASGCIVVVAMFHQLAPRSTLSIDWLRLIEMGRPETTIKAFLDSLLDLAGLHASPSIRIEGDASGCETVDQHLDGRLGHHFGFRWIESGWLSQLPDVGQLPVSPPLPRT
ncbi:MAG: hypothetical protein KDG54_11840 [Geminicoccaceae bacterium]|nr:hypothetical protein [Geminicoccaceae bacterium]